MISTPTGYAPYADERHVSCLITVGERSFGPDDVKSISLKYSASITSEAQPGSELTFEVQNSASVSGFFEGLDAGTEIAVSLIVDGVSVNMGTFLYASISYKESDLMARVSARDMMIALGDVTTSDLGGWSTLSGAVSALLPDAAAEFAGTLGSTPVVRGYDETTSKREALRQLAQAACCSCWYTRDKKIRFASMATIGTWVATIDGDRLRSWDMLSMEDATGQVALTANVVEENFYYNDNQLVKNRDLGSATIPAKSVGYVRFSTPGEMLWVNGYDATDMTSAGYWSQLGVTLLENTIYGIKVKTPAGILWETDPWNFHIQGIEYGVTPTEYTSGTGTPVKSMTNPCVPSDRAAAVAAWIKRQLDRRARYTVDYRCDPSIEIGDVLEITDKIGTSSLVTVCGIEIEYDGGLKSTLTCVRKGDGKEPGDLSITPTSMSLDADTPSGTITVTRAGDGAISAVSSNTEVATVSMSGNIVTVTAAGRPGYATVTVSVAEGTYHLAPADAACTITSTQSNIAFADCTWAEIIAACQSKSIPDGWAVGDSKTMTINGTEYQVDIIGMNHDAYADGSGTAPLTLQLHNCCGTAYAWNNHAQTSNIKLWADCWFRAHDLPKILALMPSEVQAAIKNVTKKCKSSIDYDTTTTVTDGLFLLSYTEVAGNPNTMYPEPDEGSQYAYYAAGNSKVKKLTDSGAATAWWTRSPDYVIGYSETNYGAKTVTAAGTTGDNIATVKNGISPAWCF